MSEVITQKELAKQLNLTQGTVSRALRGQAGLSRRLRSKVLTAARKAGYELPNGELADLDFVMARHTGVICVDIARGDAWHDRLLDGAVAAAQKTGHEIMVCAHAQGAVPRVVTRGQVDGLVRLMSPMDYVSGEVAKAPVATVTILFPVPGADVVSVDHFGSAFDLGKYLGSLHPGIVAYVGHSDPISDSRLASGIGQARFNGFRGGLEQSGAKVPAELVRMSKALEPSQVKPLVEQLLDLRAKGRPEHQFTLIGFYNDYLARHAIEVIRARGLRVPEDIGVAGYDDIELPVANDLKLTTVHLPLEELGAEAVQRVHWRMENQTVPQSQWVLPTRVVEGNSVRKR